MSRQHTDCLFCLTYKEYLKAATNAYANKIEREIIIDQQPHKSNVVRYRAKTTVEMSNSELRNSFLSDMVYRCGSLQGMR